jgi:hypothetical protein
LLAIRCDHGRYCVSPSVLCDSVNNCGDGTDERNCNPMRHPTIHGITVASW